ncbi:carboxylesterase family protein [Larkinella arboricola]
MIRHRIFHVLLLTILLLGVGSRLFAQKLPPGPQVLTIFSNVDDTEQPYGLYLPKNYNPKKKYPLVIMLHGAGSNHRLSLRRVFGKSNINGETDVEATKYFPEWADVNYIVASPFARGTVGYQGVAEKDVYDVLADVKKRFSIDDDRVYLTGYSMGGGGTLWIGLSRPDVWAAIAPVCPAPPRGTDALAGNALNYPVHIFQGDADPAVKVEGTREWVQRFKDAGVNIIYQEYPGVKHDSWVNAYQDGFIFSWFDKFKRNRFPERVRFSTRQYKYNSAYWVQIDQLTPGTLATVDARFSSPNHLDVTTSNIGALTLKLAGHRSFKAKNPLEVVIDGKTVSAPTSDAVTLVKRGSGWEVTPYQPTPTAKRPGAEGPLSEPFADRHVYVYGTADNPSPEELKNRQDQAFQAANWSAYRGEFLGRIMVFPRILADKEIRPSDLESANLVLFGTKETNSLVAKFSDRLPIQLNPGTSDYGLFYVFPVNNHYVTINSGLPWWTDTQAPMGGFSLNNRAMAVTSGFKDFILFKGTYKTPVAEGYFDNDWHLKPDDASKLSESGAVTVATGATASN